MQLVKRVKENFLVRLHACMGIKLTRVDFNYINTSRLGKLPATQGASNPELTEPASMFCFYLTPYPAFR